MKQPKCLIKYDTLMMAISKSNFSKFKGEETTTKLTQFNYSKVGIILSSF